MSTSLKLCMFAVMAVCCQGYRYGPPMGACDTMFPHGHHTDARNDTPPFIMAVNATTYNPGDIIEVNITSTDRPGVAGEWFFEGIFVQARTFQCDKQTAIGTFVLEDGCSDFLQVVDCFGIKQSAVRHFTHIHVYNRTFYWKAPSTAAGHVYLRATVARNYNTFWMNIFSGIISDPTDTNTNLTKCPVLMKYVSRDEPKKPVDGSIYTQASFLLVTTAALIALFALN